MERMICQCCGEALHKRGDVYECGYCGATYRDDQAERAAGLLKCLLDDFKIEQLSNARRRLYETTHEKYPSSQAVTQAAGTVLSISPDDFMARMYLHSHDADPHELIGVLARSEVSEWEAKETVDWLVRSLDMRALAAVKDFADRHLKGTGKTDALNHIEDEAFKLDSGVYDLSLKRDVFLCYSTEDMPRVIAIMETFEENALSCFAAFRNLRHGKGAQENYQEAIFRAMRNCRVFVFLSSNSSRDPNRKGVAEELDHLVSDLPKKPRVEFLLEDYPERMPILAKRRMAEAFPHLEYCREPDDLIVRVSGLLDAEENAEKDRVKKLAEEASEKAKKELQAEFEAREAARKEELARELEERLAKEKEKLEAQKASSVSPVGGAMDAESMLAMMEKAEELKRKRAEEASDKRKAEAADDAIRAIGTVECSKQCKSRIDEAQRLYDALTKEQRAYVHNAEILQRASQEYHELAGKTYFYEVTFDMKILPDGNASVAKCQDKKIVKAAIPERYRGKAVTSISEGAFSGCPSLKSITIPSSVTTIGNGAFSGCKFLTSITIPEGVTTIGERAFYFCPSLTSIVIPSSVASIGDGAFGLCPGLKSVTVDPSNPEFDSRGGCNAIIEAKTNTLLLGCVNTTIPDGVTSIGDSAFVGCASLKSIAIPSSVTSIGEGVFYGCFSLESITISNSVTSIGERAFSDCSSLKSITIPESVTSIGYATFAGCSSLKSIAIPDSVTSIDHGAFSYCSSLKSIVIPKSVHSISGEAFENCSCDIHFAHKKPLFGYPEGFSKDCLKGFKGKAFWGGK